MFYLGNLHYCPLQKFSLSRCFMNQPFRGKAFPQQHEANRLSPYPTPSLLPGFRVTGDIICYQLLLWILTDYYAAHWSAVSKWLIKHTEKTTSDTSGDPLVQYDILFLLNMKRVSQYLSFWPTHIFKCETLYTSYMVEKNCLLFPVWICHAHTNKTLWYLWIPFL